MIQQILVGLIFIGAIAYIVRLVIKSFKADSACATGCGKCAVDFTSLETQLKKKGL